MTEEDEVYQRAILELARDRTGAGRMEAPDATATVDNPMCGDRVTIDLRLMDGRVTELRHHVRGCLLCEAAAGLLARHAPGADVAELRALPETVAAFLTNDAAAWPERFAEGTAFTPVRPVRNRHRCVTLAFEAVVDALDHAGA
ncbi:MAG: iron-sulfur cluster assembly scaffold protein [Rhodospirillaceae bacterium]|nr:iron-sulfur cluster assembly scaffold protein [Rhodospirillaceae bacterium]